MAQMIELAGEIKDINYHQTTIGKDAKVKSILFDAGTRSGWIPAQYAEAIDGGDFAIGQPGIMCAEWIAKDRGFI